MHKHAHRSLASTHDLGHLGYVEVAHHPQQDRIGLVLRQTPNQRKRPIEVVDMSERGVGTTLIVELRPKLFGAAGPLADVVQQAVPPDGEQPSPKRSLVATETRESTRSFEPRVGSDVLSARTDAASQVAKEQRIQIAPQERKRLAVTDLCPLDEPTRKEGPHGRRRVGAHDPEATAPRR